DTCTYYPIADVPRQPGESRALGKNWRGNRRPSAFWPYLRDSPNCPHYGKCLYFFLYHTGNEISFYKGLYCHRWHQLNPCRGRQKKVPFFCESAPRNTKKTHPRPKAERCPRKLEICPPPPGCC